MTSYELKWLEERLPKDLYKKIIQEGIDPKSVYKEMREFLEQTYPKTSEITKRPKKEGRKYEPERKSVREHSKDWPEEMKERAKGLIESCPVSPSEEYTL